MKKSSFVFGTIILAAVNLIVRSLGFIYRIILSRLIGAEAIGLYQMVYPFLMIAITITTAGIPIAVSKMIAKENSINNKNGVYKVLGMALLFGGVLSFVLTIIISLEIRYITFNILKNPNLYYPVIFTIPAITFITFSSILRGFFYGLKDIKPAANAQILEQIFRIAFVLTYIYYTQPDNPVMAANIAIVGISIGEFFSLLYLVLKFNLKKITKKKYLFEYKKISSLNILSDLLYISVPITLSRLVSVVMQSVNSILIPQRLVAAGLSSAAAIEVFGKISGMAMPLLFLPFTVTTALVINIIPNISEQLAVKNYKEVEYQSSLALRVTILIALPVTIVFVVFGQHIASLVYNDPQVGNFLSFVSYATLFLCLQHTSSGILHGMGKQVITTLNYLCGMGIQLYCTYFLIPNPQYGINGFFIGFLLSTFIIATLNIVTLSRSIKINLPLFQTIIKPLFCSLIMITSILFSFNLMFSITKSNNLSTLISCAIGGLIYLLLLSVTKTFNFNSIKPNS
ncbi:stage V sporulation protein B [Serpentinicella sp. ANB-PHB4]|uniref:stage V sporulation protein B n=1 Tax=Serpentinicella sp. ANB-PHB4 TaxID=3074076 RepID=UPI0028614604|nr:stage V sporulation protein B [Serpentinicella sp. ANB-PHB4]MDR5657933.1 stage V sporulation protein B [Serpentinicella sp. ANB-PHB4]